MPPQHSTNPNSNPYTDPHNEFSLLSELESHNTYFDSIVNLIPARLYVAGASGDDYNPSYQAKYGKGQHKESKEARRARSKVAKREKFLPGKMESTLEVKRRVAKEEEGGGESDDDDDDGDVVMSDGDGEDENDVVAADDDDDTSSHPKKKKKTEPSSTDNSDNYASRIEMLRAKLHAKMAEKRAAAGITADDPDNNDNGTATGTAVNTAAPPALVSKRAARRAEKKRRQEAAKLRNKKNHSVVKDGASSKGKSEERVVPKDLGGSTYNAPKVSAKSSSSSTNTNTTTTAAQDLATIDYQSLAGLKPKLDGTLDNKSLKLGKQTTKKNKKKSLEKLLADAERKQERLRELKQSGLEEDREKAAGMEWGEAMKVAGGANLRKTNDPKLLKKALKRKSKKKAASAKAWNVRLDQAKDAATKKQAIRSHNLDARKLGGAAGANLSSKRIVEDDTGGGEGGDGKEGGGGKKEKRRRQGPHSNRAGFEGKKSGFINGEGGSSSGGGGGGGKK